MSFLLDIPDLGLDAPADALKARTDAYYEYLQNHRELFPKKAWEFAIADWHYDFSSHQSPHDAWVENLTILEPSSGSRSQYRAIGIVVRLRGSYHDGYIELRYKRVRSYALTLPHDFQFPPSYRTGHGDWLVDELRISERALVVHEVRFSRGSRWLIECEDVEYKWLRTPKR